MSGYKKSLLLVIPLSFAFGVWWGMKMFKHRRAQEASFKESITILTYPGILSPQLINKFQNEQKITVKVETASQPDELLRKLESQNEKFDVASLYSYQVPAATQSNLVGQLDTSIVKGLFTISADLQDIPGDLNHDFLVPVLWGLTGFMYDSSKVEKTLDSWEDIFSNGKLAKRITLLNSPADLFAIATSRLPAARDASGTDPVAWLKKPLTEVLEASSLMPSLMNATLPPPAEKLVIQINHGETAFMKGDSKNKWRFVLPKEKAPFWILSYAITAQGTHKPAAQKFLNFLLEKNSSVALMETSQQASASRNVEEMGINPMLKPSYLREVPLTRIHLWPEFNQGPAVANIVNQVSVKKN